MHGDSNFIHVEVSNGIQYKHFVTESSCYRLWLKKFWSFIAVHTCRPLQLTKRSIEFSGAISKVTPFSH